LDNTQIVAVGDPKITEMLQNFGKLEVVKVE
jgi:hypothetical protein